MRTTVFKVFSYNRKMLGYYRIIPLINNRLLKGEWTSHEEKRVSSLVSFDPNNSGLSL